MGTPWKSRSPESKKRALAVQRNYVARKRAGLDVSRKVRIGCSVSGCDRRHRARGFCGMHWARWKRGTPLDRPNRNIEQLVAAKKDLIRAAREVPCTDCGGLFPLVAMDLDHVRGQKVADLSAMSTRRFTLDQVRAEIAKCEPVCSNCHRVRTSARLAA